MNPNETIPRFDAFLAERGLRLEPIAAGGTALALMGIIHRETRGNLAGRLGHGL